MNIPHTGLDGVTVGIIVALLLWSSVWKALALFRAGRRNQPIWFVVLFIVNTAGILELVYLVLTSKRSLSASSTGTAPGRSRRG